MIRVFCCSEDIAMLQGVAQDTFQRLTSRDR